MAAPQIVNLAVTDRTCSYPPDGHENVPDRLEQPPWYLAMGEHATAALRHSHAFISTSNYPGWLAARGTVSVHLRQYGTK